MKKQLLLFVVSFIAQYGYGLECFKACFGKKKIKQQQNQLQVARPEPLPVQAVRQKPLPKSVDWAAVDALFKELQDREATFAKEFDKDVQMREVLQGLRDEAGCNVLRILNELDGKTYEKFLNRYYPAVYILDNEELAQTIASHSLLPRVVVGLISGYLWEKGRITSYAKSKSRPNHFSYVVILDNNNKQHVVAEPSARAVMGSGISSLRVVDQERLQKLMTDVREPLVPAADLLARPEDDPAFWQGVRFNQVATIRNTENGVVLEKIVKRGVFKGAMVTQEIVDGVMVKLEVCDPQEQAKNLNAVAWAL